jgi:2-succinyl-6-hydroxy-2,4-cyclohexadiene-1-carboxylate synthase
MTHAVIRLSDNALPPSMVYRPQLTARWGQGSTSLVMLHGFTGSGLSFSHLAAHLGEVVTALCPDLPGHHGAGLPLEEGTRGFIETVDGLAEALPRRAVVYGYSQGARIALLLAARHPHKVQKLILEGCHPGLRQRHDRLLRRLQDERRAQQLTSRGVEAFVDAWERLPLFSGLRRLPAAEQAALRLRRVTHEASGLAGALRCLGQGVQPDVWPLLPKLHVPTLILTGSADIKYTQLARRMVGELPSAWRKAFEGIGHAPHLECPAAWADEVRAFLAVDAESELEVVSG